MCFRIRFHKQITVTVMLWTWCSSYCIPGDHHRAVFSSRSLRLVDTFLLKGSRTHMPTLSDGHYLALVILITVIGIFGQVEWLRYYTLTLLLSHHCIGVWRWLGRWDQQHHSACTVSSVHWCSRDWKFTVLCCLWTGSALWVKVPSRCHNWHDRCLLCFWYSVPQRYQWGFVVFSALCFWYQGLLSSSSLCYETCKQP